ncbi:hypothetical protein [Paenibacillus jiagnxiensis]|uniref:hypothetical protein n=1 Tax=Paenibacillus jiagnxiensis TaxID=3228926 RepID=UPI0033AA6B48
MGTQKRKSPEERLHEIDEKVKQLKARQQKIKSQVSQQERKARTRRLIQVGAMFEKYFETQTFDEAEALAKNLKLMMDTNGKSS